MWLGQILPFQILYLVTELQSFSQLPLLHFLVCQEVCSSYLCLRHPSLWKKTNRTVGTKKNEWLYRDSWSFRKKVKSLEVTFICFKYFYLKEVIWFLTINSFLKLRKHIYHILLQNCLFLRGVLQHFLTA